MTRRAAWLIPMLLAALAFAAPAMSLTVVEVAREVRCPTCNTPLDVSNSPAADRMKVFIAGRIAEGDDKQQIIDAILPFGEEVTLNAVEVYVSRLRSKIDCAGISIKTIRGFGYLLEPSAE